MENNLEYYKAQNLILQNQIKELENELVELRKNTAKHFIKNKINYFINNINIPDSSIEDINKDFYLYIQSIKNDCEKKIKEHNTIHFCNFLLTFIEQHDIKDKQCLMDRINKLMNYL